MNEKITFVVLHYNGYGDTCNCVNSILNLKNQDRVRIVIVDNASTNDSYVKLQKKYENYERIILLHNEDNLGFSRANNIGLEKAEQNWTSDFFVFANNDLVFDDENFITQIETEYEKSHFGVLGPDIYNPILSIHQSPIDVKAVRTRREVKKTIVFNSIALALFPLYFRLFASKYSESYVGVPETRLIYQEDCPILGACFIVSNELVREKGKVFEPETFFYYEEYILSYWCQRHGFKVIFDPEIHVLHYHGRATNSLGDRKTVTKFRMRNTRDAARIYERLLKDGR